MSVFVREDDATDVEFYVLSDSEGVKIRDRSSLSEVPANERDKYEECHVKLKGLNWGKACALQSSAMTTDPMTAQRVFDGDLYVRRKLKAVIVGWNFTDVGPDGSEMKVPVSEESVDQLYPVVADYILNQYRKRFELSETDRKNF